MCTNSSNKSMISWKKTQYDDITEEQRVNEEIQHFITDILNTVTMSITDQKMFTNCDDSCGDVNLSMCAQCIAKQAKENNDPVPVWFSDIVVERAILSINKCNRKNNLFREELL